LQGLATHGNLKRAIRVARPARLEMSAIALLQSILANAPVLDCLTNRIRACGARRDDPHAENAGAGCRNATGCRLPERQRCSSTFQSALLNHPLIALRQIIASQIAQESCPYTSPTLPREANPLGTGSSWKRSS